MELSQENLENFTNSVIQVRLVEKVGEGVKNFSAGDLVACGGGGFASIFAENTSTRKFSGENKKKKNLHLYSTVALGSIAMHAVRRSKLVLVKLVW